MNRWWDTEADEVYWLEVTDREDLGVDLKAPQVDDSGRPNWRYGLMTEVRPGDLVFHYSKPAEAITAVSRAVGEYWDEPIIWGARGTVARRAGVTPYLRPGWRRSLEGFYVLPDAVTMEAIAADAVSLRTIRAEAAARFGQPIYFPFETGEKRPPRPLQGYLFKLPAAFVEHYGALVSAARAVRTEATLSATVMLTSPPTAMGAFYREAAEDASTSHRDPFSVDPALVDRGLRGHAMAQNALAESVASLGLEPRSPAPDEPNYDLGWEAATGRYVAEVKSITLANEEKQLRLGLGQVLRYRQLLGRSGCAAVAVLMVERQPSDPTWQPLCDELGVLLAWPDRLRNGDFLERLRGS